MNPLAAIRDLRMFLHQRRPHELGFLALSIILTGLLLIGFYKDSNIAPVYRPKIIYVKQWTLKRTDAEIKKDQVVDEAEKQKQLAAIKKQQDEVQAQFKKMDQAMSRWGL